MTTLFRKRLIPAECISLKDDQIIHIEHNQIITKWKTFRPKADFSHGISYYVLDKGWKISRFFKEDNTLAYIYCDIIDTFYNASKDTYTFTDLLADVIIKDNQVKVVDLDELADACSLGLISNEMLVSSLHKLNNLLTAIYDKSFEEYLKVLDSYL
ncbi:MAG: DUF402 domain-containing protein [Eubacteriales bacterium]|nr:DUF402 domain-containing protein [Eubacteriales bacterium]